MSRSATGRSSSSRPSWAPRRSAAADDLLPVPGRPGPADVEGDRPADRQSREGRRRAGGGEAEPVRPTHRRHQDHQPQPGGQSPALAGLKGYVTNLQAPTAEYVLGAYHQLWQIEHSFRMSKTDLRARPIYHHKRDSIEAHLTIVMAALAVSCLIERSTQWSISRFVKTLRRYHTVTIRAGSKIITAADPLPADVLTALAQLTAH